MEEIIKQWNKAALFCNLKSHSEKNHNIFINIQTINYNQLHFFRTFHS